MSGQIRISSVNSPSGNTNITNLPSTQSTTEQGKFLEQIVSTMIPSAGTGNYYKAVPIHVTEGTTTLKILNLHALKDLILEQTMNLHLLLVISHLINNAAPKPTMVVWRTS